jgi:hypothetical protein
MMYITTTSIRLRGVLVWQARCAGCLASLLKPIATGCNYVKNFKQQTSSPYCSLSTLGWQVLSR